eukprot:PhF_6_TR38175/c0_g1_i2/m.57068
MNELFRIARPPAQFRDYAGEHTQLIQPVEQTEETGVTSFRILVITCDALMMCEQNQIVLRAIPIRNIVEVFYNDQGHVREVLVRPGKDEHDVLFKYNTKHTEKDVVLLLRGLSAQYGGNLNAVFESGSLFQKARLTPVQGYSLAEPDVLVPEERCPCWPKDEDVLGPGDGPDVFDMADWRRRVRNFYLMYNPERLAFLEQVYKDYSDIPLELLAKLEKRYGPEPTAEEIAAIERNAAQGHQQQPPQQSQQQQQSPTVSTPQAKGPPSLSALPLAEWKRPGFQSPPDPEFVAKERINPFNPKSNQQGNNNKGGLESTIEQFVVAEALQRNANTSTSDQSVIVSFAKAGDASNIEPIASNNAQARAFTRRPGESPPAFWYFTNEGFVVDYDVSPMACAKFGYYSGDRVLATWGPTAGRWSTVIGVRGSMLWVHDDGEIGASYLWGFIKREDFERRIGWVVMGNVKLAEASMIRYTTNQGYLEDFNITPEACHPFGFYHGERVQCTIGVCAGISSTVIGVARGHLWFHEDGDSGASYLYGLKSKEAIVTKVGWRVVGATKVVQSAAPVRGPNKWA